VPVVIDTLAWVCELAWFSYADVLGRL